MENINSLFQDTTLSKKEHFSQSFNKLVKLKKTFLSYSVPKVYFWESWSLRRDLDPRPLPYQGAQIIEPMSFRAFNWPEFKKYVQNKYRKTTAKRVMCYANRYYQVLESGQIGQLNAVPSTTRSEVIKSLIIISKYVGCYEQFKAALKSYGIKSARPDALAAFVRIYSNKNSNLDEWFAKVKPILTPQENLLLRFLRLTGLRCSEGIESFNLIIELSAEGKIA